MRKKIDEASFEPRFMATNLSERLRRFYKALAEIQQEEKLFRELYPKERTEVRRLMKIHKLTRLEAIDRFLKERGA